MWRSVAPDNEFHLSESSCARAFKPGTVFDPSSRIGTTSMLNCGLRHCHDRAEATIILRLATPGCGSLTDLKSCVSPVSVQFFCMSTKKLG